MPLRSTLGKEDHMLPGILDAPDEATADLIARLVRSRTGGRIRGLCISFDGNRLIINGETSSYYDKQLASHAALESSQTFVVQNDLVVG
jgi:hypothetical protein